MLRLPTLTALLAGTALLALGGPARAADLTPDAAASLEGQVRTAFAALLGPAVPLSGRPVQITADGDHYDVVVPLGSPAPGGAAPVQIKATAKPGDNGTWVIDDAHLVTPASFTLNVPQPPAPDAPPGTPMITAPVTYTVDLKGQKGHIVWDPSFATASSYTSSSDGMTVHAVGGASPHDSTAGASTSQMTMQPVAPGRSTIAMQGSLSDYQVVAAMADSPLKVAIQKIGATITLTGADRAKGAQLIQAAATIIAAGLEAPAGQPPRIPPAMVRPLVDALQDFASDLSLDETVNGLATTTHGQAVGIETARLGLAVKADGGMVGGGLDLGMTGLTVPGLANGPFGGLVPKQVALHPTVSGLSVADLHRLAETAMNGQPPTDADLATLFTHGGITAGLDSMALDVGGTMFTGSGKFLFTGTTPDQISGTARITADHFDALTQKLGAIPPLAQAVPVLLLAKGLGRAEGSTLVWDITQKGTQVLVNNVDVMAMVAGAAGGGAPTPAPVPAPGPGGAVKGPAPAPGRTPLPTWAR